MSRVVAIVGDLLDRSRIEAAAGATGARVQITRSTDGLRDALEAGADLLILDLSLPGVLEILRASPGVPSVGYASHVDRSLLREARAAGCDQVLARSAFFGRLPDILRRAGNDGAPASADPTDADKPDAAARAKEDVAWEDPPVDRPPAAGTTS